MERQRKELTFRREFNSGAPNPQSFHPIHDHYFCNNRYFQPFCYSGQRSPCRNMVNTGYKYRLADSKLAPIKLIRDCLDFHQCPISRQCVGTQTSMRQTSRYVSAGTQSSYPWTYACYKAPYIPQGRPTV